MTELEKQKIIKLRTGGYGYIRIAQTLGMSENTVKSFCRRNSLCGENKSAVKIKDSGCRCRQCGKKITQTAGRKPKVFCSDGCRIAYWTANQDKVVRRTAVEFECPVCHGKFKDYPRNNRKYCSRECYIKRRYGDEP